MNWLVFVDGRLVDGFKNKEGAEEAADTFLQDLPDAKGHIVLVGFEGEVVLPGWGASTQ